MPINLLQSLEWNRNVDKRAVARRKVLISHFSDDFSIQSFKGMNAALLIRVYSFITRDISEEDGSHLISLNF